MTSLIQKFKVYELSSFQFFPLLCQLQITFPKGFAFKIYFFQIFPESCSTFSHTTVEHFLSVGTHDFKSKLSNWLATKF